MDLGLALLRLALGGAMVGHAGRHLLGWAGGSGFARLEGAARSRGFRVPAITGAMTGLVPLAGGILVALGLFSPLGPLLIAFDMLTALGISRGKPFFVTQGGSEHAWTYLAVAIALALTGPGAYSLDAALATALSPAFAVAALGLGAALYAALMLTRRTDRPAAAA